MFKAKSVINEFLSSSYFPLLLAAVAVVFWATGWEIAGAAVMIGVVCLSLWLNADLKPVLAVICLIVFVFSLKQIHTSAFKNFLYVVVPLLVLSFAFNFLYYQRRQKLSRGRLFSGMLIGFLAALLSGLFYPAYDKKWFFAVLGVGIGIYLVYFICINFTGKDLKNYICMLMVLAGFVVVFEILIWYLRQPDILVAIENKSLRVGWGMSNTMAVVLVMAVPAAVYLSLRAGKWAFLYYLGVFCLAVALLFTLSRGNLLFGTPVILISCLYGYFKSRHQKLLFLTALIVLALCILIGAVFWAPLSEIAERLARFGLSPNGRFHDYNRSLNNFWAAPLTGVGYFKPDDGSPVGFLWKAHNTVLQILSCGGIVGVLAMVPFYYQRYAALLKNFSEFKFLALLAVLAFELEGMIDLTFLSIYQLFFVLALIAAAEKERLPLPVFHRRLPVYRNLYEQQNIIQ